MTHYSLVTWLCLLNVLAACGTLAPMQDAPSQQPVQPQAGEWSLSFSGGCTGQDAEAILITRLTESEIAFDDFQLLRNEAGEYVGSANFIAPMPVDGREIPYTISYTLRRTEDGGFVGSETIVEGGGHGIACPVELVFVSAE